MVLEKLPAEYDSRIRAFEVDEKPTDSYNDLGGLEKELKELVEAIVLPLTNQDAFKEIGIQAPKGVLLFLRQVLNT